ncbi:MAG: capsid protein [Clostridia bacterium]
MKLGERVKNMIRSWLDIRPAQGQTFLINENMDFQANCIRNKIWYRGDSHELAEFYGQLPYSDDTFWGAAQTADIRMKKSHSGLPKLIVKTIINTVMTDYAGDDVEDEYWKEVNQENEFDAKMLKTLLADLLHIGDGAIKINYDANISDKAILEWVEGSRVDFVYKRGRLVELIFKSYHEENNTTYLLEEHYGYGYIIYKLLKDDKEVALKNVTSLASLKDIHFDKSVMWAVPIMLNESAKYKGRGESIFDGKYDSFDSLDEIISQWLEAVRAGRAIKYIPEDLLPKDPETGEIIMGNPFDNKFIKTETTAGENDKKQIDVAQPEIPTEQYLQSYITFLDLCLQGIISPSTLGIDNKKLDNAEAQREKEKTTLYTRGLIIDTLTEFIPKVINAVLKSKDLMEEKAVPADIEVNVKFGEYNNPSFEAQVETVGKGKTQGIMSIEASVDELYGDSKDDKWKAEEVARLKAEQGIVDIEEPAVNFDLEMGENEDATDTNVDTKVEGQKEEKEDQEKEVNE